MGIRILFLHGLEYKYARVRLQMVQNIYGVDRVSSPNLRTTRMMVIFSILYGLIILLLIGSVVGAFIAGSVIIGVMVTLAAGIVAVVTYLLGSRLLSYWMMRYGVRIAQLNMGRFEPNLIVASSFGAVVALNLRGPKLPMLLFGPAQDAYARYLHTRQFPNVSSHPYVLIVHGNHDSKIPLADSIRLLETGNPVRCRLEVIDDDDTLHSLSEADLRIFIDEVWNRGGEEVRVMAATGNKVVDASLFESSSSDDEESGSGSDSDEYESGEESEGSVSEGEKRALKSASRRVTSASMSLGEDKVKVDSSQQQQQRDVVEEV